MACGAAAPLRGTAALASAPLAADFGVRPTLAMRDRPATNMRIFKASRAPRRPGDVFAYLMPDGLFRFGRLISTTASGAGFEGVHLVYFYKGVSPDKFSPPRLSREELLVPPILVNQKPWTLGYFEVIERRALGPHDVLPVHCFRDLLRGRFYDDKSRQLANRIEPCGIWGLQSYRTVDDELSKALGFELVPDVSNRGHR